MPNDDTRSEYTVDIAGLDHTMLLDEDDAERYGDAASKAGTVSTKAKQPANKSAG